ncbi:unnamed protein product [Protopolystoma xenopodis]|uniref:Uncharacterized protein n=1 Tax=Protopolystoma xenopodis TaxID=117903 RepID=A0A3S5B349_9PLAT|nr:unnamed protein product [Protopolystoma xenopodis]
MSTSEAMTVSSKRRLFQDVEFTAMSSLAPLVKIFTSSNRAVRLIWTVFSVCMAVLLIILLSLVVLKYLSHSTVLRLDQLTLVDGQQPPAVTLCLGEHIVALDSHRRDTTASSGAGRDAVSSSSFSTPNIVRGVSLPCQQSDDSVVWVSSRDAVSPYYNHTGVPFQVTMLTTPPSIFSLDVIEQVPKPPNLVCTTFQLNANCKPTKFWKMVRVPFVRSIWLCQLIAPATKRRVVTVGVGNPDPSVLISPTDRVDK